MIVKIALRNIFRQRKRSLFTAIGMIFGMVVVSFSISLTDGSYSKIINTFTKNISGHVQIHSLSYLDSPSLYKSLKNYDELSNILNEDKRIKSFTSRVYSGGLGFHKVKSTGLSIQGIDPVNEESVTGVNRKFLNNVRFESANERAVIITKNLSNLLKISIGEKLVIISQGGDGSIANDLYKVKGLVDSKKSGLGPNLVLMPIATLQEFLSMGDRVHEISILLKDIEESRNISKDLQARLSPIEKVEVSPWPIVLKDFYKAMQVDKQGGYVSMGIIILVVSIGILNTVLMSVLERTREFGVLKAIGTRPFDIFKLIVIENAILCFLSLVVGLIISSVIVYYFSINEILLSESINYGGIEFSGMNTVFTAKVFIVPSIVVLLSTMLVTLLPAIRAALILPIKAMSEH